MNEQNSLSVLPQILYFWVSAGFYIYHEADNVGNGQTARLLSPALSAGPDQICVQFYYYMYGADNQNNLRVLAKRGSSEEQVWERTGIQSPSWLKGSATVTKPLGTSVEVSQQGSMRRDLPSLYSSFMFITGRSQYILSLFIFCMGHCQDKWPITTTLQYIRYQRFLQSLAMPLDSSLGLIKVYSTKKAQNQYVKSSHFFCCSKYLL